MDIDDILESVSRTAEPLETVDLQQLTRAWVNERVAPELLPYPITLIERVLERIRKQIELVEEQTGNMDPKTNYKLIIIQTELERLKYLVRSFLRTRIAKIDRHPLHLLRNNSHLSPSELQYLDAHQTLLNTHYQASFLSQFPVALQRLDDTAGGISMIEEPDLDAAVFCRVLGDIGRVGDGDDGRTVDMQKGDVWVCRWRIVRERVLAGDIELI